MSECRDSFRMLLTGKQGLALNDGSSLYVSDSNVEKHSVNKWRTGQTVASGSTDQLPYPDGVFVDHEQSVSVAEFFNNDREVYHHTKAKESVIVVASSYRHGSDQIVDPIVVTVD